MTATMVDTCVLLDLFTNDPTWCDWSAEQLKKAADAGPLIINPIIYAELSVGFTRIEDVEALVDDECFEYRPIPREAAFLAGQVWLSYRRRGGEKSPPLPDFFIGSHAGVEKLSLLTRDVSRYRTYFPGLALICP